MEGVVSPSSFWQGRRVLVTGHTGFKGGWLSLWLQALGADVTGFALRPEGQPNLFEVARVGEGMESIIGDIRNPAEVRAAFDASEPEVVFHLAAQALVRQSYAEPIDTFATNVVGTAAVLDAARRPSVQAVVSVTSDKCYENREWPWGYREDDHMGGHDPYSASKGCAELVTASFRRSFFHDPDSAWLASARAGNVIGGGDWSTDRLIPDMVRAFTAGEPVVIRNPDALRPWQHVLEPLAGYLLLGERLATHGEPMASAWNFGPADTDARPVHWVVDRMADRWGDGAAWVAQPDGGPHEAQLLKLDCSKARTQLGWTPRLGLDGALDWLVDWYRAHLDGADMRAVTLAQIERFSTLG
ncbi:MAG: CDP-glucose 4,6-dehydratase [Actinomycetota bacterium]